jgi:hypothetical protein
VTNKFKRILMLQRIYLLSWNKNPKLIFNNHNEVRDNMCLIQQNSNPEFVSSIRSEPLKLRHKCFISKIAEEVSMGFDMEVYTKSIIFSVSIPFALRIL